MGKLTLPFDWPERGLPLSPVVKSIEGLAPSDYDILVPHESIRYLNNEIEEILKNFNPLESAKEWQGQVFAYWLKEMWFPIVDMHHYVEENSYIPALARKGCKLPEKTSQDHQALLPDLQSVVKECETGFSNVADLEKWKVKMRTLINDYNEHMSFEEQEFPLCIKSSGITEEDNAQALREMLAEMPLPIQAMELPCIMFNMHRWLGDTEAVAEHFTKMGMPDFVFEKLNTEWIPQFRDDTLTRLAALKTGSEPWVNPRKETCTVEGESGVPA